MRTHNLDTQSGHIRVSTPDLRRAHHLQAPGWLNKWIRTPQTPLRSAPLRSAPRSCAHAAVLGRIRGIVRVAPDLYYSVKHTQQGRTRIALEAVAAKIQDFG